MNKETLDFTIKMTQQLINAETCSRETKETAQAWLDSLGTENETSETKAYLKELEDDIMPIDTLIGFAESDSGAQLFGADKAKEVAAHANEIKSAGARYCDCPACIAVASILEKKDELLK